MTRMIRPLCLGLLTSLAACGGAQPAAPGAPADGEPPASEKARELPPASAAAADVRFPKMERWTLENGLEVNAVRSTALPVAYALLVVRSGHEASPKGMPGLSHLTAAMLEEGTTTRSSAKLAEDIEFLGSDLWVHDGQENVVVGGRMLTEHFDATLTLLADMALKPAFRDSELKKLKAREESRLTMEENQPRYLAQRAMRAALYGEHPYAVVDTTKDVVAKVKRTDLAAWHKAHFVPSNAFLVVVGDVAPEAVKASTDRLFGAWKGKPVAPVAYPAVAPRTAREIIVVDRPASEQSVIYIGNLALARASADYVPLLVANQVLGGGPASRLFMDLREKRSLSYGAYSSVGESVDQGAFIAMANVRNAVTKEALAAFFEHLGRIVTEAPPAEELREAQRFLTDRFPLEIDTPARVADLLSDLRIFGLPDSYWDTYRSEIAKVTPADALKAAQTYIHPDRALVVVVGKADDLVEPLRAYGPVQVVDRQGKPVRTLPAAK